MTIASLEKRILAAFLTGFLLFAGVLALFWRTGEFEFVNFDDYNYVPLNPNVLQGLTPESISWAFSTGFTGYQHPLTWLSLMLDIELFGANPGAIHLTNVFLHAANTLLLFSLLFYCTGLTGRSALVALLFAIHPQRIESVAWVAERKDVLWVTFGLIVLHLYARYRRGRGFCWYAAALVTFGAALLAKPMAVVVPPIMLLMDIWPLGKAALFARGRWNGCQEFAGLVINKLPFFILAAGWSVLTAAALYQNKVLAESSLIGWDSRFAIAAEGYLGYLRNFFFPYDLAVLYPLGFITLNWMTVLGCVVILALVAIGFAALRNRPWISVGLFWFLWVLFPVSGLLQNGPQSMADRYSYFASIGLLIAIVWEVAGWLENKSPRVRQGAFGGVAVLVIILAFGTYASLGYWRNSVALWEHTLSVTEKRGPSFIAHANMAAALMGEGRVEEAKKHAKLSWLDHPRSSFGLLLLAETALSAGEIEKAEHGWRILAEREYEPVADLLLAQILYAKGEYRDGVLSAFRVIQQDAPGRGCKLVSEFYDREGDWSKALKYISWAARLEPLQAGTLRRFWRLQLKASGSFEAALQEYLLVAPSVGKNLFSLLAVADAEADEGRNGNVLAALEKAAEIQPSHPETLVRLARVQFLRNDAEGCSKTLRQLKWDASQRSSWLIERCLEAGLEKELSPEKADLVLRTIKELPAGSIRPATGYWIEGRALKAAGQNDAALAAFRAARSIALANDNASLVRLIDNSIASTQKDLPPLQETTVP